MAQDNPPKFDEKDQNVNDQAARQKATRSLSESNININVRFFFDNQNGQKRSQSFPDQLQQIQRRPIHLIPNCQIQQFPRGPMHQIPGGQMHQALRGPVYQIPNGQDQIPPIQQPHLIDVLNFPKGKQNDGHSDDSGYSSED